MGQLAGRTSLRHAEDEDGGDALPDEAPSEGRHRDGAARPRLQSDACHQHHGLWTANRSDEGVDPARKCGSYGALSPATGCVSSPSTSDNSCPNVFTRPRPKADIDAAKPPVGVLPFSVLACHDTMPYLDCQGRR